MKPILIAVALLAGTFTKSFANDGGTVDPNVLKSFQSTFASATEVDWSMTQDLYKAVFFLNGQYITAYYNADGTMHALTRYISAANLPVMLRAALKNDYKHQWITGVLEVTKDGELHYYVTLEDAGTAITLCSSSSTTWTVYEKQRKD